MQGTSRPARADETAALGSSDIASLFAAGFRLHAGQHFSREGADVVGWDVNYIGPIVAGS